MKTYIRKSKNVAKVPSHYTGVPIVHPDYMEMLPPQGKTNDSDPTYIANQKRLFKWA